MMGQLGGINRSPGGGGLGVGVGGGLGKAGGVGGIGGADSGDLSMKDQAPPILAYCAASIMMTVVNKVSCLRALGIWA